MTYRNRVYLHGLVAAAIGGFANVISNITLDPEKFNLTTLTGLKFTFIAACISAGIGAALYLKQHPLPDPEKDVDAVETAKAQIAEVKKAME